MKRVLFLVTAACLAASGCSDPGTEQVKTTIVATYDPSTGRLKELTLDQDKDGTIDTWTEMDGARPVRTRTDRNGDGKLDRWEYFNADGTLEKVGFSRRDDGIPDAWAFAAADGKLERIEISSTADVNRIDRWEHYNATGLARAEDDSDGNGTPDKWETYEGGAVKTAAFDDDKDGRPDRRLTYKGGALVLMETEPDAAGGFARRVELK